MEKSEIRPPKTQSPRNMVQMLQYEDAKAWKSKIEKDKFSIARDLLSGRRMAIVKAYLN